MSHKIAKALRKEIKYHPTDERVYTRENNILEIHPTDKRALYQELKKEAHEARKRLRK